MIPIGYLGAIAIAVLFTMYLDGAIGVMMLAFLLLMPLLSLGITLWMRHSLQLELKVPEQAVKQRGAEAVLLLTKKTPLPLPFLRLRFYADAHFEKLNPNAEELPAPPVQYEGVFGTFQYWIQKRKYQKQIATQHTPDMLPLCLSMGIERSTRVTLHLNAQYCGNATVTISHVTLSDFLGMFRFPLKLYCEESVLILPEIPEIKTNNQLFQTVANASVTADEDNDATPIFSAAATPGYEHRDYLPGDPLKRVNWKLSSKRKKLMVRKDEPAALAKLSVVLDFHRASSELHIRRCLAEEELLIETALGLLQLCVRQGYPCVLYYQDTDMQWKQIPLDSPDQLAVESILLLRSGFRPSSAFYGTDPLPQAISQQNDTILLYFATNCDHQRAAALDRLTATLHYISPRSAKQNTVYPKNAILWDTTDDHHIEPING